MRKKRIAWNFGNVFGVKLPDGDFVLLKAIDLFMPHWVYVAITNKKVSNAEAALPALNRDDIISLIAISKKEFDSGEVVLLGNQTLIASKPDFKNELYKDNGYIGAKTYDTGLAADFLIAFHKLAPWDDWGDPDYLEEFLISPKKKPKDLIYLKRDAQN
jgi:hypothetical protein